jgi:ornithine carbamoyltransferase
LGRDFLSSADLDGPETLAVLDLAGRLKADRDLLTGSLRGRSLALLLEKPSLRTKASFLVGAARLGLAAVAFGRDEVDLGRRESVGDGSLVLARYFDVLVWRTFAQARLEEMAAAADVPVVNALSDHEHPCQALADVMTLRERFGRLEGLELAWIGDGNNVCHSLALTAARTGMTVRVASPEGYTPSSEVVAAAVAAGGDVELAATPEEAVAGAHAILTDTWVSMGQEGETEERRRVFEPYQVNEELLALARPDAVFLHCLPAHRGEEVTDGVMDGPASVIHDEAENRLWVQTALLALLLGA